MITVYLDESNHEDPDNYMTLAGFFGDEEQWSAFVPDWKAALGKRPALHMREIQGWASKTERIAKSLKKLGDVPHKHDLFPIFASLRMSDYLDIVANSRHEFLGYSICLTAIMITLKNHIPSQESIKIVCEMQGQYEASAIRTFGRCELTFQNQNYLTLVVSNLFPKGRR
jgi:hypothetical protein